MNRIATLIAALVVVAPRPALAELKEVRQTIFGMD
jgi:hypothetical protein